jgi:hypothetical protein
VKGVLQKVLNKCGSNNGLWSLSSHLTFIQGDSLVTDIIVGDDFLGLCHQKISYKRVSDSQRLRSYASLKLKKKLSIIERTWNKVTNSHIA